MTLARHLLIALLAVAAPAGLAQDAGSSQDVSKRLNRMFGAHGAASAPLFPLSATAGGRHEYDGQFANDLSEAHREAYRGHCRSGLKGLEAFDRERLSAGDRLSYDVFRRSQLRCLDRLDQELHLLPLDQGGSTPLDVLPVWAAGKGPQPFRTVADYENFLRRMSGLAGWIDTAIENMRAGLKRGLVHPRQVMLRRMRELSNMVVDDPARSPFYQPIVNMPQEIQGEDRRRLAAAYESAIRGELVPAYRRLRDFLNFEYLVATQHVAGLAGLPEGARLYAYYVRTMSTLDLKPQEIAALGRREMARTREQMEALKTASGYTGDLRSWAAQLAKKRTRYATTEEALAGYRELHERVHPRLPKLFGALPKAQYEIQRTDVEREETTTTHYRRAAGGRPAIVFMNMRGIRRGPITVSERLFLHEALPGHHLQIALAQENRALPGFRRGGGWLAFVEGWAVYAESLGFELELYRDPSQHLAMLSSQLSRMAAMVVDVGLHSEGWTLGQAVEFLRENTLEAGSEANLMAGVERQHARPAFILGYSIGGLKFHELRSRAEKRLGAKFDVRAFHDEILKDGAMPLDVLEAKMERWIAAQR